MGWQDVIAIGIVFGVLLYLVNLLVGRVRRSGSGRGCGSSCGKCSSSKRQDTLSGSHIQVVEIGLAHPRRPN